MDNLDADIERLKRVNNTLSLLEPDKCTQTMLRKIEVMRIEPSQDLRELAGRHAYDMPKPIRILLRGIGAWDREWRLVSYLVFEPTYLGELINLGYRDATARQEDLRKFLRA